MTVTRFLAARPGYPALGAALATAGLGPDDLVHLTEYVPSGLSTSDARAELLGSHQVPVSRIPVVGTLSGAPYLVEATAVPL